ncbi:YJL043W [Saccharomyces arboricola H-6]|uniref:YJL043W n=1 Tax=Saccharomyces arboricola (strain H-6 / AS 2.3317 / CBS 10644) TaxID=1160507 RepID=J8Q3B2_SACAR|nr:YJL043W [Saccharomyces arboricola H-6]
MFVDYSGLECYTDINASFGKLVNTYCCFVGCNSVAEQLGILKSLLPKYYEVAALTDTDFVSARTGELAQKLLAMALTLRQINDCLAVVQKCDTVIPIEIANPTSFECGAATAPLRQAYARLLDDWTHHMGQSSITHTGWASRLQRRFSWRQSRTIIIPMLFMGETATTTRDLTSVLHDCEIRHASEVSLRLLWTSSPELVYATPQATSVEDVWSRYDSHFNMEIEDQDEDDGGEDVVQLAEGHERKCVVQLEALLGTLATTDPLFQW